MEDFLKLLGEMIRNSILQGMKDCIIQIFEDIEEFSGQQDLTREGAD